ncbi:MAG: helix-turn-helix domain-containing protein [Chloroflexi bacterium]|nr:helix-turn-helix domain-containing protein [Chloroflexota bacterium]
MTGVSVREARDAVIPPAATLLGGGTGLDRHVTGTAVLRARTPAFPSLQGGELALVSLSLLRQLEPRPHLDRLVGQLAPAEVAAIVFFETHDEDPESLAAAGRAADASRLPVFAVPSPATADEIDLALHRYLSERRAALLRRGQELQHEMTTLALAGHGIPAIVERLAAVVGLPVTWEDRAFELRSWVVPPGSADIDVPADGPALLRRARLSLERMANTLRHGGHPQPTLLPLSTNGRDSTDRPAGKPSWQRLVVPFTAGGEVAGFISVVGRNGQHHSFGDETRLALTAAGLAASIEGVRARTLSEAQGNATADLLRDWLAGRFDRATELTTRARQLGHVPAPPYVVVVLEPDKPPPAAWLEDLARAVRRTCADPEERRVSPKMNDPASPNDTALWASLDERRVALLVQATATSAGEAAKAAERFVASRPPGGAGTAVYGGVGRPAERIEDVPRAYREAVRAAAVARRLGGRPRVAYFGGLGVYRLLAAVSPPEELAELYEETLGPLLEYDRKTGGDLVATLEAYIACNGSPVETAKRLHTHRNTVLYRLDRICEALGVDVRRPEHRIVCYLALRAGELLGDGSGDAPVGAARRTSEYAAGGTDWRQPRSFRPPG